MRRTKNVDTLAMELKIPPKELRAMCEELGREMIWHKFYDPKSRIVVLTKNGSTETEFYEFEIELKGSLDGSVKTQK